MKQGHGLKLRAVRPHTDFGRHSYGYRTVALWNQLSPNTVWAPNIGTFKYFLKQECFSEFLTQMYDIPVHNNNNYTAVGLLLTHMLKC